jgi:thiosulfate/3-mercaptopyruvate sulfurtransferase
MIFRTLISSVDLATHLGDASWRIFDCRHDLADPDLGERAYREAHIPNARFLHLDRDLSGLKTGKNGRHPLPDPDALAATLARHGVSNDTQVIAYDEGAGMFAARLWWLLRWLGHDEVALLDGGLGAWKNAGYPVTNEVPAVSPSSFHRRLGEEPVSAAFVQSQLHRPDILLIDARTPERFRGETEPLDPVAGHIPGAVNRPCKSNLEPDGRFKSATRLRAEFDALLRQHPSANIVSYCGSGVTACHHLLALEMAGLRGARLYPGSWSEWCSDRSRATATGTE